MTKQEEQFSEKVLVPEEDVWNVLEFAKAFGYSNAMLTPLLVSQRLKDITLNSAQATEAKLIEAMNAPKDNEKALQSFSQDFEIQSQVYKKLLSYLGNFLAFDMSYECTNVSKAEEYKSPAYRKDLDVFKKFVDGFDYRKEFTVAVNEMLRNEAYFCAPRTMDNRMTLQELPSSVDYTMIDGHSIDGLTFSFNMYWFIQPGVDLLMYPEFFQKKFKSLWSSGVLSKYVPSISANLRGQSSWVYWQPVPNDVGWVFKFNPYIATRVPYFAGLFLDLIQQPLIRALQKNINMSAASNMILGQIGMLKDTMSKEKNQFSITAEKLGNFLSVVKAAVGESIKVAAAPLENLQAVSFPANNEVYSSFLKTSLATSGINTNLIFTSDVRPNSTESQLSLNVDEQMMFALYPQFESFMNFHINKKTKKYKFKVHFEGSQFFNNRAERFDKQMSLAEKGIVMPHKIAASIGMNPFEFQRNMDEARALGWTETLTPIFSSFQLSGKEGESGRPQKEDGDLSDSGVETRGAGSNIDRGGKV